MSHDTFAEREPQDRKIQLLSLEDPELRSSQAGAKAAHLGRLLRMGFPVPDGFVIPTDAFVLAMESRGDALPVVPPAFAEAVRVKEIIQREVPVAVRSSGVAEDGPDASYAGQFETFLNVRGADAVLDAIARCFASALDSRLHDYREVGGASTAPLAVLVQRMVSAAASGVAFTADPITGDRGAVRVAAVRGLGERLVSGAASADEWDVRIDTVIALRTPEAALSQEQVKAVAELARKVEASSNGVPQDIEWAFDEAGRLHLLQARPITTLPEVVSWEAPTGGWARYFRFGEWLPDPVTPLFADWGIGRLEKAFWRSLTKQTGLPKPEPTYILVHSWYFGSLNFWPPSLLSSLGRVLRHPRMFRVFMQSVPALVHWATQPWIEAWRGALRQHVRHVSEAETKLAHAGQDELFSLIDGLLDAAGAYFVWIALVAGVGYKTEVPLGEFWQRHLWPVIGGSHQDLLIGLGATEALAATAVASLDWFHPLLASDEATEALSAARERQGALRTRRSEVEARARASLRGQKLRRFEQLLEMARHYAVLREEVVAPFTAGWPVLRRAVLALGVRLVAENRLSDPEKVFFLRRAEVMNERSGDLTAIVGDRRRQWRRSRRLTPPWQLGEAPTIWRLGQRVMGKALRMPKDQFHKGALQGIPAAPGLATGPARIVRGPDEFHRVQPGDILIAPATPPAWTPLFAKISAIVTDTGSPMAHASLVAREYGIPAVVATGEATRRFRDGEPIQVDGASGLVYRIGS